MREEVISSGGSVDPTPTASASPAGSTKWKRKRLRAGEDLESQGKLQLKLEDVERDIAPAAENNIETKFILLEKGRVIVEGQHKACLALVADETAAVHFQLWGDECDAFEAGDIIHLSNGIFSTQRNNLVLRAGKRGKVERIGEFTMSFVETPNMSEIHWIPDPTNSKKYIQGHVISPHSRLFPPIP